MAGNVFGKMFKISTWGESHGKAVGVVVEGCPANLALSERDIQKELDRRRPGKSEVSTPRKERDKVEILSGVFEGKTLGTPISMIVRNLDVDSTPYEKIKDTPRPGHADFTYRIKYGHVDWRGGGRAAARETVGRVAAGAIAKKLLAEIKVEILGHVIEAAGVKVDPAKITPDNIRKNIERNPMRCADLNIAEKMREKILEIAAKGDSSGGIVELIALNVPAGLGETVFDKLDAEIAKALMSIGAVKGVEIGAGFQAPQLLGSEMNDEFFFDEGVVKTRTNNAGGILGGISTGMPIITRIAVKPTPSISLPQKTVNLRTREGAEIKMEGRFDPNICPRIVPVAEAMLALVLVDHAIRAGHIPSSRGA